MENDIETETKIILDFMPKFFFRVDLTISQIKITQKRFSFLLAYQFVPISWFITIGHLMHNMGKLLWIAIM